MSLVLTMAASQSYPLAAQYSVRRHTQLVVTRPGANHRCRARYFWLTGCWLSGADERLDPAVVVRLRVAEGARLDLPRPARPPGAGRCSGSDSSRCQDASA